MQDLVLGCIYVRLQHASARQRISDPPAALLASRWRRKPAADAWRSIMNVQTRMPLLAPYPELGEAPIPVEPYLSQEYYEAELNKIFRQDWLVVGREEEIANPGDYKVKKLDFARTSVILIRGKDGKIGAFHNVCRHRGNKVISETGGEETFGNNKAAVVTCRFHGWVYNAKGELVDVPMQEKFPSCFNRAENGLVPIHVGSWAGFVFVNLAKTPSKTLDEFLGGVKEHFEGYPFNEITHCHTYYAHINCNWKVGMDAFCEGYHVPTIHAGSFPGLTDYWQDDVAFHGDHRSIAFYSSDMNPPTPVGTAANELFGASIALKRDEPFPLPKMVNPKRHKNWGFEQTTVFPNFLIHVGAGLWFTHQFWPVTQDKCLWEGKYYLKPPTTNSQFWAQRYAVLLQRNAWLEDTATMEDTQQALLSGVLDKINLQDDEIMLRHQFHIINGRVTGK
jgi:phenylpropionate dioxygenase-like ring-hydroxylating dioxygenase large terminal subunit